MFRQINAHFICSFKNGTEGSSARTKTASLNTYVLAPFSVKQIVKEISEISFYSIATDSHNHEAIKLFLYSSIF